MNERRQALKNRAGATQLLMIPVGLVFAYCAFYEFDYAASHDRDGPAWVIGAACSAGLLLTIAIARLAAAIEVFTHRERD